MIGTMLIRYYEQKIWFFSAFVVFEAIFLAQFPQNFKHSRDKDLNLTAIDLGPTIFEWF